MSSSNNSSSLKNETKEDPEAEKAFNILQDLSVEARQKKMIELSEALEIKIEKVYSVVNKKLDELFERIEKLITRFDKLENKQNNLEKRMLNLKL